MMLSSLIAITLCVAVWLLLQNGRRRVYGAVLGLANTLLWVLAALSAGTNMVALIAGVCALQFACFLLAVASVSLRRSHAH